MLQTIIDVSKHHPSVYAVCMISLIVQTAFSVFYSFAAIAVYVTWTPGNPCEFRAEQMTIHLEADKMIDGPLVPCY